MVDQSAQTLPYLDGWRGLAIVAVLLGHFGPHGMEQFGPMGVQLFFVLSGFFMSRLLFIRKVPLTTFFVRRFNRVLPTFWLFIMVAAIYAATLQPVRYVVPVDELLSTLVFLRTYMPQGTSIWEAHWSIGHIWSLNVEEHSYVYLALITLAAAAIKWRHATVALLMTTVGLIICFALLYLNGMLDSGVSAWRTHSETASLGLIAAATYNVFREKYGVELGAKAPYLALAALVLACACFAPGRFLDGPRFYLMTIVAPLLAAFAVNHASQLPQLVLRCFSHPLLRWFGTCSFSIYLWQNPLYSLVHEQGMGAKLVALLVAIAIGALSYYAFENPLRIFLNRRWMAREQKKKLRIDSAVVR
jgi:peptidoglycan/LPS O-acetylase OafA/YrhL